MKPFLTSIFFMKFFECSICILVIFNRPLLDFMASHSFYFQTLLGGLDSKDWVLVCEALNNVRRLSIFHKDALLDLL